MFDVRVVCSGCPFVCDVVNVFMWLRDVCVGVRVWVFECVFVCWCVRVFVGSLVYVCVVVHMCVVVCV